MESFYMDIDLEINEIPGMEELNQMLIESDLESLIEKESSIAFDCNGEQN